MHNLPQLQLSQPAESGGLTQHKYPHNNAAPLKSLEGGRLLGTVQLLVEELFLRREAPERH